MIPDDVLEALALGNRLVRQIPAPAIRRRHQKAHDFLVTKFGELYAAQENQDSKRTGNRRPRK